MSADVIRPAAFAQSTVVNPKTRGRPKGTDSLRTARRRREAAEAVESPYHPSVVLPPVEKGRFHYPKELLLQKYICQNSYGWMVPSLCPGALGNGKDNKFLSPLNQLLEQLEAEGHDIAGARLELAALREIVTAYEDAAKKLAAVRSPDTYQALGNERWDIEFDGYR